MYSVNRKQFESLLDQAIRSLSKKHRERLENVAFLVDDEPSLEQRRSLALRGDQTLFGLYEGVPLSNRQGQTKLLPDKITLFQHPLEQASGSFEDLQEAIRHTVWHEVAHYYGLNHSQIATLE